MDTIESSWWGEHGRFVVDGRIPCERGGKLEQVWGPGYSLSWVPRLPRACVLRSVDVRATPGLGLAVAGALTFEATVAEGFDFRGAASTWFPDALAERIPLWAYPGELGRRSPRLARARSR